MKKDANAKTRRARKPKTRRGQAAPSYEETCEHGIHYGGDDCFACYPKHPAIKTLRQLFGIS